MAQGNRPWPGPRAVTDHKEVDGLDADTRQLIQDDLTRRSGINGDWPAFFAAIDEALTAFQATREANRASRPATIRATLDKAARAADAVQKNPTPKAVDRLETCIDNLDGHARTLVREAGGDRHDPATLHAAHQAAQGLPTSGRLFEAERVWLAADIAEAMEQHLGICATATREGPFEVLLEQVLPVATGQPSSKVNELACRALHAVKAPA